jgi:saccharopine dehydrogenase-like NADP-dependent oxidoreductase
MSIFSNILSRADSMSNKILILGAGLVSQPLIDYLSEKTDHYMIVADINLKHAEEAVKDTDQGVAELLDVADEPALVGLIENSDLVVSLLPYTLHGLVARHCLNIGRSMLNASYVSDEMRAIDEEAKEKGLLFLCEMGLDPGIDHMSAMQIIDNVKSRGGTVTEFVSVCGGLPAPDSNDNPFGYKFSWSPKGVLLAGKNSARYISNGRQEVISSDDLFHSTTTMHIEELEFEAYPNRDSISYENIYGLEDIDLLMRGTLRYAGWHNYILGLRSLNLLVEEPIDENVSSYAALLAHLNELSQDNIRQAVADKLSLHPTDQVIEAFNWLGLFSSTTQNFKGKTVLEAMADIMSRKMAFSEGERDMVALQHQFKASFSDHEEQITSTLIDYGQPDGYSSMARTVSLPLAIAVRLILEGKITLTGVQIPVHPTIYRPVLEELEACGIAFKETTHKST